MTDAVIAGAYTEVLSGDTTPDRKLASAYLDVLTGDSVLPDRKLASAYLDVLIGETSDSRIATAYVEVLVKGEPYSSASNVFDSNVLSRPVWRWDGESLIPAKMFQVH